MLPRDMSKHQVILIDWQLWDINVGAIDLAFLMALHWSPQRRALLEKALGELDGNARTSLLDEFQQRWIDDWMLSFVYNARPLRRMLASNIGGYDKWAGFWMQYSSNAQVGRWYYVEK